MFRLCYRPYSIIEYRPFYRPYSIIEYRPYYRPYSMIEYRVHTLLPTLLNRSPDHKPRVQGGTVVLGPWLYNQSNLVSCSSCPTVTLFLRVTGGKCVIGVMDKHPAFLSLQLGDLEP